MLKKVDYVLLLDSEKVTTDLRRRAITHKKINQLQFYFSVGTHDKIKLSNLPTLITCLMYVD